MCEPAGAVSVVTVWCSSGGHVTSVSPTHVLGLVTLVSWSHSETMENTTNFISDLKNKYDYVFTELRDPRYGKLQSIHFKMCKTNAESAQIT